MTIAAEENGMKVQNMEESLERISNREKKVNFRLKYRKENLIRK